MNRLVVGAGSSVGGWSLSLSSRPPITQPYYMLIHSADAFNMPSFFCQGLKTPAGLHWPKFSKF